MRIFLSKVLKLWSGFSLIYTVKCEKQKLNELLSKNKPELEDWKISQVKVGSGEKSKDMHGKLFDEEIMVMTCGSSQ